MDETLKKIYDIKPSELEEYLRVCHAWQSARRLL